MVFRGKVTKQACAYFMSEDKKRSDQHKTEKIKYTEKDSQTKTSKKKQSKCSNRGQVGHTKSEYAEPVMKK